MKPILLLLIGLTFPSLIPAQNLLQEAQELKRYFDTTDANDSDRRLIFIGGKMDAQTMDIFRKLCPGKDTITTRMIEKAFKGNPFLRVEVTSQNKVSFMGLDRFPQSPGPSNAASPTGFSVTNLADGLARFLVKRTKQELSMAFFDDFKKKIKDDPYLGNFCPLTKAQLELVDSEVYQFNDYLESLREAFAADMMALPGSTERYMRDPILCKDCLERPQGKVITDLFHIAQQMVNGEPPVDMIAYLSQTDNSAIQSALPSEPVLYDMAGGLRFLNIVSESLRNPMSKDSLMPWYTAREIRTKFKDPVLLQIYLGLLWQNVGGIDFVGEDGKGKSTMRSLMKTANKGVNLVESWRRSIESVSDLIQSMQFSLRTNTLAKTSGKGDFFSYAQSVTDLLQSVNQIGTSMLGRSKDIIPNEYILLARQCNSLFFNVRNRNFAGAVGNLIYTLNLLHEDLLVKKVDKPEKEMSKEEKTKAKLLQEKRDSLQAEITTLLKYANFMAAIAEASTPDEMEHAIEIFALPPGSSRLKKQSGRFLVALNAYTGFALGKEYLGNDSQPKDIRALTAPVGLSISYGLGKGGSIGAFIPVIDVGAVTAYRFNDKNASNLPELTWTNILAPGLYLTYDFPGKWPIAVGYGAQLGPGLRKVTEANGLEVSKSGWRQGFFASVDIPITYLYLGRGK